MSPSSSKSPQQVNDLLHALRGEQFRRSQNAKGSKSHLNLASLLVPSGNRGLSSLPKGLSSVDHDIDPTEAFASLRLGPSRRPRPSGAEQCAGPVAPKSWTRTPDYDARSTPGWRAEALSLIFSHDLNTSLTRKQAHDDRDDRGARANNPTLPSLTLLCLRCLLSQTSSSEFVQYAVPYLPPHLRRLLVRDTIIRSPLPDSSLFALCGPEGHVAGELVVVGPAASLPEGYFQRNAYNEDENDLGRLDDWDTNDTPEFLHTLVLVSTPLTPSTLLHLPPTITNLVLIHLPTSIQLYRLPTLCPLLEILDLSYNVWLAQNAQDATKLLDSVDWGRWAHLRILGLRGCYIPENMIVKLNKGRWDDVQVVR
ncbi:hypothetical protein APHAL10511_000960 [Amanita phalloides]|nr:hypothetical protein APHAL10511_000960 [Amanita phalloides]